jgi:hypothetical protein
MAPRKFVNRFGRWKSKRKPGTAKKKKKKSYPVWIADPSYTSDIIKFKLDAYNNKDALKRIKSVVR